MNRMLHVKPDVFRVMQTVDIDALGKLSESDLRPILPCLVRMALCAPVDNSDDWTTRRKRVLKVLSGIDFVNGIVTLLSIDFRALEQDVKKEQQLRSKIGGNHSESVLISQLTSGLALEFERSDPARRIRLLLSELLFVISQLKDPKPDFYEKSSELFDSSVYLEEVSDVLCIAQAELPALLPIKDVSEALIHVQNGGWLLCRLVANSPDCFKEVCSHLVANGEKQDEETAGGRRRMQIIQMLCDMSPSQALNIRSLCVQNCTMPGLAVSLTLAMEPKNQTLDLARASDTSSDLTSFVTGILLGNNINVRNWFSQFIKMGQKRKRDVNTSMLHAMRLRLLEQLILILPDNKKPIDQLYIVRASSFIRLYCALKGMASLRFTDEEMKQLLRLVTSRTPTSKAGARFISLGLCLLIACPYLLGNSDQEKQAVEWIRWLMSAESSFDREAGSSSSFGEMLFLIAIHFHSNQIHAIAELVCSNLGMKSAVKANALARMRQIFTQEIFTEQVITSHAVKVPVTDKLNADMTGYLPIHSVYQLLNSRAFSKHQVTIKDWIYRQICRSSVPVHPLMPSLIDVYVNSIIVKSSKSDHCNEPIKSQEILDIYHNSVFHDSSSADNTEAENLSPQLLTLYYVLLYEDTLLNNIKSLSPARKVSPYPDTLLSQIPINFLIQTAQREQQHYAGLFSSLLRLLVTQYPHLCNVEDWLEESLMSHSITAGGTQIGACATSPGSFKEALSKMFSCPTMMQLQLQSMMYLPIQELLPYADTVAEALPCMLEKGVPRKIINLAKKLWSRLHTLTPRRLRLSTVNALRPAQRNVYKVAPYTENDITVDPLIVLRCDDRVFRCPPVLEMVLRVLESFTQASRVYLNNHLQANPIHETSGQTEQERRELKNALVAAQESAIIQILLECCQQREEEKLSHGLLSNLREVQCIMCSYLHQVFIADPYLAKLLHFQGYPCQLIPMTVAGIPSMHICLDFIPELLSQPQIDKQIFAIKLTSHLCCQYALPKSLSVAKLVINVMFTIIGVLENEDNADYFCDTVPCLVQICQAFPPLCEDVTSLLTQIGSVCVAKLANTANTFQLNVVFGKDEKETLNGPSLKKMCFKSPKILGLGSKFSELYKIVLRTFSHIVDKSVASRNIY